MLEEKFASQMGEDHTTGRELDNTLVCLGLKLKEESEKTPGKMAALQQEEEIFCKQ